MKRQFSFIAVFLGFLLWFSGSAPAQSFADGLGSVETAGLPSGDSASDGLYTTAMQAINEQRWANAEELFTNLVNQHSDRTDAAAPARSRFR